MDVAPMCLAHYKPQLIATIGANCWKVIAGSLCHVGLCTLGSSAFRGLWWLCGAAGLDMAATGFQNDTFVRFGYTPRPELATRIKDAQPKALIWASCGVEPKGVLSCSRTHIFCGCWLVGSCGPFEGWMVSVTWHIMLATHCNVLQRLLGGTQPNCCGKSM